MQDSEYISDSPINHISARNCAQDIQDSSKTWQLECAASEIKSDYARYECDEKLDCLRVSILITPETGQFMAFRDNDYLPEVQPSTRTALVSARKGERIHSSSRLRKCQTKKPSSSKPIAQKRPARTEKRRTNTILKSSPTKMAPKVERMSMMAEPAMLVQSSWVISTRLHI